MAQHERRDGDGAGGGDGARQRDPECTLGRPLGGPATQLGQLGRPLGGPATQLGQYLASLRDGVLTPRVAQLGPQFSFGLLPKFAHAGHATTDL
jgi:hypothetical protein